MFESNGVMFQAMWNKMRWLFGTEVRFQNISTEYQLFNKKNLCFLQHGLALIDWVFLYLKHEQTRLGPLEDRAGTSLALNAWETRACLLGQWMDEVKGFLGVKLSHVNESKHADQWTSRNIRNKHIYTCTSEKDDF